MPPEPAASESLRIGEWLVEPATGVVRRNGQSGRLEPRTMELLCLLASEPGRVFSKEEILDEVWSGAFVEEVAVARCVSNLRQILGDDARNPSYIETIPKRGYRLIAAVGAHHEHERAPVSKKILAGMVGLFPIVVFVVGYLAWPSSDAHDPETSGDLGMTAYDFYLKGRDHYKQYRATENQVAIEMYTRALDLNPSFALGHAELANAQAAMKGNYGHPGDWGKQAIRSAARSLELQPDLPEAHKAMGHAMTVEGRVRDATGYYRRAIELRPDYSEAIHNLALMLQLQGQYKETLDGFARYHRAGYETADSAQHVGWTYLYIGLDDAARRWFQRSLKLEPYHFGSQKGLAILDLQGGRLAAARQRLQQLVDVHPTCPSCWSLLGDVYLEERSLTNAISAYRQTLELTSGEDAYASLRLGQCLRLEASPDAERFLSGAARLANDAISRGAEAPLLRWITAATSSIRGERELALAQLQTAIELGWRRWHLDDSAFDRWRDDSTYEELLADNRRTLRELQQRLLE